ncbi:methyltransferase domain-containing protein [Shewanella sp. SR44-3]|uniref:methyltransferase domain-containing protein n=1 Tax=unclassified Shewanella TaxID=196818 RepID=UPI0038575BBE
MLFLQDKKRTFYDCQQCAFVFADPTDHRMAINPQQITSSKSYGRQQKMTQQRQASQFVLPLLAQLSDLTGANLVGLNFGSHLDSHTLDRVQASGHQLMQFDPFNATEQTALEQEYDFVCSYKVFERFKRPLTQWNLLSSLVKPHGWLAIGTALLTDKSHFAKWHHKNNPAHVSFYQHKTFEYLATQGQFKLLFAAKELVLMQKAANSGIKPILI